ncbi:MAG TPA: hypothetical protein VGG28_09105 [Kofleriaceae bacterium]
MLVAGCSKILGIGNLQTAADAASIDGGGIDAHMTACASLGSNLAVSSFSYGMATSFGDAACAMFADPAAMPIALNGDSFTLDTTHVGGGTATLDGATAVTVDGQSATALTGLGSIDLAFIVATSFTLGSGATIAASGSNPLVILASGPIEIDGVLSISAPVIGVSPCMIGPAGFPDPGKGGGGGTGGAYQGGGAGGGASANGELTASSAGVTSVYFPYPGCTGGPGAGGGTTQAMPGGGIYLVSLASITIASTGGIDAGGSGGPVEVTALAGGAGGASGGTIMLETPTINNLGTIAANGGGGAGGEPENLSATPGQNGRLSASAASGGTGMAGMGDGGDGAADVGPVIGGSAVGSNVGAGGGGGGVGYILVHSGSPITGTTSPAVTAVP